MIHPNDNYLVLTEEDHLGSERYISAVLVSVLEHLLNNYLSIFPHNLESGLLECHDECSSNQRVHCSPQLISVGILHPANSLLFSATHKCGNTTPCQLFNVINPVFSAFFFIRPQLFTGDYLRERVMMRYTPKPGKPSPFPTDKKVVLDDLQAFSSVLFFLHLLHRIA